jgi:hypothetical protein
MKVFGIGAPDGVILASSVGLAEIRTVHGLLDMPAGTSNIDLDRI